MSKARSPRDVCSMTMGTRGLMRGSYLMQAPLAACTRRFLWGCLGGPQFRRGLGFFLLGRPDALARTRELDGDRLDVFHDAVEGLLQPQVGSETLVAAAVPELCDHLVGVLARPLRLLADERAHLLVVDLEAELVLDRLA